jgi:hypothetical protein
MKQIATALVKAQKAFGPALKTSTNPHFKSRYADLSNCVEAVIDALNDNGIYLMQKCYENQNGVTVETMFIHESGEMIECGILSVPATKMDAQGYGSALTYARRYSLMAACGIAPEDDDGNNASRPVVKLLDERVMIDHIAAMDSVTTQDDLIVAYKSAFNAAKVDPNWQKRVIAKKDEMKARVK